MVAREVHNLKVAGSNPVFASPSSPLQAWPRISKLSSSSSLYSSSESKSIAFFLVLFRFQSLSLVIVFRKGCVNWARRRVLASSTSRGSGVAGNRDWGLASAYANSSLVERPFIEFLGSVASVGPSFLM